jgi:CubicO group peptidase (beta-lactamase class C family)
MQNKRFFRSVSAFWLILALFTASFAPAALAQSATKTLQTGATVASSEYVAALAKIEDQFEQKRAGFGIPGAAIVIVKDDQIVYLKGFGYKDYEKKLAVTPDTQFAIGSATKAFTGLSVMMSQDEGKLSLDDSPKKYLSYFKINDADADAKITVRDLLSHSSGLNRTDLAMVTGKLNRAELIRVAGEAQPTAKLREKFQYQNLMFAAAGEIVAQTQKMPWEKFVAERIFKPLGMTNSNLSIKEMERAKDVSFGYEFNSDTKETRRLPYRAIDEVAPAGSINSSARDMANWLRFMLSGGVADGKRLVTEAAFAELTKPQMKIAGKNSYGLGWFIQEWNGMKVVQHGGNIDGFNALVGLLPEKKAGFVILTNVSGSPFPAQMMPIIWENLTGAPNNASINAALTAPSGNGYKPDSEVGKYRFEAAGFDVEIKLIDGKLTAIVPGQPNYVLENVSGRRYKLTGAPDGFFVTFKDAEAYLEQPQGNYTLPRVKTDGAVEAKSASESLKELVGKYESEKNPANAIEVAEKDSKISLVVAGQPPYELREKSKDTFNSPALPDDYAVKAKRDASGKITGIVLVQPNGEFAFNRANASAETPKIAVEDLMAKVVDALGGEANWRKLNSRVSKIEFDFIHQGVKGVGTSYSKAPNLSANEGVMTALGKEIATSFDYFDGREGAQILSFSPPEKYTGKLLEDTRLNADFYGFLNWKTNYKTATVKGAGKVGDEDVWIVIFEPEKGNKNTIYFSQKTFLPLKRESFVTSATRNIDLPFSETYSDYRAVDGIKLPFRTVNSTVSMGDLVTVVKEVKHNQTIDDKTFRPRTK